MSSAPRLQNFIGGRWQDGMAGETIAVLDPATGEHLADVPLSDAAAIDAAVAAAAAAFPGWRATPPVQRARVLFRLKALLEEHLEQIAVSVSREHGKTLADARGEVRRGIENVEHACGIPSLMMGTTLEDVAAGIDCETVRQPLGVFAAVTPYNFPVMVPMWFWPYAVATGNTFVLKPSEQDPVSHQLVVRLCERAGLPAGVLNVVHGDRRSVDALLANADVKGISFVGSSQVAAGLYGRAAAAGKRVQALGGAKNHMLVLPDADMELVTEACMGSLFGGAGQRCLAGSIVVGVGGAGAAVRERLLEGARALRLGRGLDEGVDMGPLISARHRRRVREFVDAGEAGGAHLLLDGREASVRDHPRGQWFGPTLFEPADPDTALGRDEIFGPVAGIAQVDTLEQAVELMHRNPYGNATSIFTRSGAAAREFRYRAGISMIGVNIGVAAPMAFFPFGGSRGSFYGDLKAQGRDAIDFYTDKRVVISRWS